jgi:GT2 family glycosyltransferase
MVTLPKVSVTLLQWGKTDFTIRAVDSILRSVYDGEIEVLVRDNASDGGPGAIAEDPRIRFFQGDENVGFGPGHNLLAEQATGELLLVLNNDTILDPRAVDRLVRRYSSLERPGAVTPMYRDFDGSILEMGGYMGPAGDGWQLFRNMRPPTSFRRLGYRATYGSAACLLLSLRDFTEVGGFDDLFAPAYYEDTDLCMKLREQGKPIAVEPTAVVYHYEGATAGRDISTGPKAFQARNRTRFVERWSHALRSFSPMSLGGALTDALAPPSASGLRILWVSPHLPRFDREAGHVRITKMIAALLDAGDLVAFWSEHCHDPDHYGRYLEALGVHWFGKRRSHRLAVPDSQEQFEDLQSLLDAVPWDVVIVSFPELASRMMSEIRKRRPGTPVLIDDVDLHFLRNERGLEMGIDVPIVITKETELATYAASDGVITASDTESEALDEELPGLPTWPFAVAADPPTPVTVADAETLLFLGNFDHHPNLDAVTWWVDEVAPLVSAATNAGVKLRVVGAGSERLNDLAAARPDHLEVAGWVEDLTIEFERARVFVAPLRYGAGTKGKILAALSHGVPVVTTTIGAEGNHDSVLRSLRVADDPATLAEAVVELMTDHDRWIEARDRASEAGREVWDRQQAATREFAAWVHRRVGR